MRSGAPGPTVCHGGRCIQGATSESSAGGGLGQDGEDRKRGIEERSAASWDQVSDPLLSIAISPPEHPHRVLWEGLVPPRKQTRGRIEQLGTEGPAPNWKQDTGLLA